MSIGSIGSILAGTKPSAGGEAAGEEAQGAFGQILGGAGSVLGGLIAPGGSSAGSSGSAQSALQDLAGGGLSILGSGLGFGGGAPDASGEPSPAPQSAPPSGDSAPASQPSDSGKPSASDKRPPGDNRSAQDIINGDPTLKNLGNQSGVKDMLKKQVGDFDTDPDAAYRASEVLKYIKTSKSRDGNDRSSSETNNGKIDGFTKDGDARHGTEAGMLQDFGKDGYSALPDDHQLPQTKDGHVKEDGTNMSNASYVGSKILDGWSSYIKGMTSILDDTIGKIPGLGTLESMTVSAGADHIASGMQAGSEALKGGSASQVGKDFAANFVQDDFKALGSADPTGLLKGAGDTVSNDIRNA
jgi:hypothetical protein